MVFESDPHLGPKSPNLGMLSSGGVWRTSWQNMGSILHSGLMSTRNYHDDDDYGDDHDDSDDYDDDCNGVIMIINRVLIMMSTYLPFMTRGTSGSSQ